MTIQEAAKKWGTSTNFVRVRVLDGRIPGCKKCCGHGRGMGGLVWHIPDDTPKPDDFNSRINMPQHYNKQIKSAPCFTVDEQIAFVWRNQSHSIASIAQALGVPSCRIPILYDQAFKRYAGKDPYAPQP